MIIILAEGITASESLRAPNEAKWTARKFTNLGLKYAFWLEFIPSNLGLKKVNLFEYSIFLRRA